MRMLSGVLEACGKELGQLKICRRFHFHSPKDPETDGTCAISFYVAL
jgi:hypothetical protein